MQNQRIIKFAKDYLKEILGKCTEEQQLLFKRMYSADNLELPIEEVVDKMPNHKIDWAVTQVENTIAKNNENCFPATKMVNFLKNN